MKRAARMQTVYGFLATAVVAMSLSNRVFAQDVDGGFMEASSPVFASDDVQLSLSVGTLLTSPSGSFPALIFPNADLTLPTIPAERANASFGGSAVEFVGTVPLGARFGLGFALGTRRSTLTFEAVDTSDGVNLEIQRFRFGIGGRYYLVDPVRVMDDRGDIPPDVPATSFALLLDAFFRVGLPPAGNRLDVVRSPTVDGAAVDGSFESSSPFATEFAFEIGPTAILGIGRDIDVVTSVYYPLVLSDVFSEDVAPGSDLSEQSIPISLGLGYRF